MKKISLSDIKKNYSILIIILLGIIYTLFISDNQSSDSFSNAYHSLWGDKLFSAHHLLYNALGYIILLPFRWIFQDKLLDFNPILILQFTNIIFSISSLFVLRTIIKRINKNENLVSASIFFVGASFGFTRFAVDNECYIIPIFLSLLSFNYIQLFLKKNSFKSIILASLFISIGCLFHQIVIWVFIPTLILILFNKKKTYIIIFISISLIIPIVYSLVYYFESNSFSLFGLFNYVISDYSSGLAEMPILKNVLILSGISFIRTFIQVHGYILEIISQFPIFSISVIIISLSLGVFGLIHFSKLIKRNLTIFYERRFVRYLWIILFISFAFACFSNGNAEFMAIIPFIIVILLSYYYTSSAKYLLGIGGGIFLWNICFGLYPYAYMNLNPNKEIAEFIYNNKDDSVFILKDKNHYENIILYTYGHKAKNNLEIIKSKDLDKAGFEDLINKNKRIYTDSFGGEEAISRNSIADKDEIYSKKSLFQKEEFQKEIEFNSLSSKIELWIYSKDKK